MFSNVLLRAGLLTFCVVALSACSSNEPAQDSSTNTDTSESDPCAEVACEVGQSCADGTCVDDTPADEGDGGTDGGSDGGDDSTDDTDDTTSEGTTTPCETADDCADDGLICENSVCVALRGGDCSPSVPCSEGFDCVEAASSTTCLEPCTETATCRAMERCWADGEGSMLGDLDGYCFANLCGPADPFGLLKPAEFMGPCNAAGEGDGICFGPIADTPLGFIGACMNASGALAPSSECDPAATQEDLAGLCTSGLCVGDPGEGRCVAFCDLSDPICEPWGNDITTTCVSTIPDLESNAGVCAPDIAGDDDTTD